jgi:catechol 2,3-dioxygenase-like lactoylglutathione lyase family enzyme
MGLDSAKAGPTIAVSDMGKAKDFYEGKLGLANGEEQPDGGTLYPCGGGTDFHVYPSPDNAGKSGATLAAFQIEDIEGTVDELSGNGVSFEQYDMGELQTDEKGIAELGDTRTAWFKDPDGNILAVWQRS